MAQYPLSEAAHCNDVINAVSHHSLAFLYCEPNKTIATALAPKTTGSAISSSPSIGNSYSFTVFLRKSYSAINSIKKSCTPKISGEMSE